MRRRLVPALIRGARGMLDWSMTDLAKAASVSVSTVKRMEMAEQQPVSDETYLVVRLAFEAAGLRFLDDGPEGVGLRCRAR